MRRLPLLIVLLSTACIGRNPVRLRPGSNVALPSKGALVAGAISSFLCDKDRKDLGGTDASTGECYLNTDSLRARPNAPVPAPPGKRP